IPAYQWHYQLRPGVLDADGTDLPRPQALAPLFFPANAGEGERDEATRSLLDRVAAIYAGEALAQIVGGSHRFTVAQLIAERGVAPEQKHYLDKLLALARSAGVVERDGAEWRPAGSLTAAGVVERDGAEWRLAGSSAAAEILWREAIALYPAHLASLQLIARFAAAIPGILQSRIDPLDLLSVEPGFDAVEQLYDCDPLFRRANEAAAGVVRQLCHAMPRKRSLRIIEIRGGTGGLAGALLAAVPADRVEYLFTDPAELAVARAEARFRGLSFVRSAVLDPDKEIAEQGFAPDQYDLVVAGAPLIAQPDLGRDLAAIRILLKPGGLLLLMVPKECGFLDLACGMSPNHASESDWRRLVLDAGFGEGVSRGYDDHIAGRTWVIGRKPTAATRSPVPHEVDPATWLVLADDIAVDPAAAVVRALAPLGQRVVIARSGRRFDRLGVDRFDVPPADSNS